MILIVICHDQIMKPLLARVQFAGDRDAAGRRRLGRRAIFLETPATSLATEAAVIIRNISRSGLLIETDAPFSQGEMFTIAMPEVGPVTAQIGWQRGREFGCTFLIPLASSAVSAALLCTPAPPPDGPLADKLKVLDEGAAGLGPGRDAARSEPALSFTAKILAGLLLLSLLLLLLAGA